jgi:hypothetical protein
MNRGDVDALAEQFQQLGTEVGYWSAARIYSVIAFNAAGLGGDVTCDYCLMALAAMEHVRAKSYSGALSLGSKCRYRVAWHNRTEEEYAQMAAASRAIAKLDVSDVHPDDEAGLYIAKLGAGLGLVIWTFDASLVQMREGAKMIIDYYTHKFGREIMKSHAAGSFEFYYCIEMSLGPMGTFSICLVESPAIQDYIANVTGELGTRAREVAEL